MKNILCSIVLLLGLAVSTVYAQNPASNDRKAISARQSFPPNSWWGWYEPLGEAVDRLQSQPGWTLEKVEEKDAYKRVFFVSTDKLHFTVIDSWYGTVGRLTYGFPIERPHDADYLLVNAEPSGNGRWTDEKHNADITRTYQGQVIIYRIDYHPYLEPSE